MTSTDAAAETRETVYAAIELSKKTWVLGIAPPDRDRPSIHRISGGNIAELVSRLRVAARNNRRILVCYEAGYDGFWLARALAKIGIECRVLDPASIQVNRRARRVKTDRIDVLALLRALIATDRGERHVCAIVRVPSVEEEDARRSHRERQRLVRERTGHINRIKGLLFAQGIRDIKPKLRRTRIDFAALETAEGHPLPDRLRRELEREYARLALIETQLREVEKRTRHGRCARPGGRTKETNARRSAGSGRHQRGNPCSRGVRPILCEPTATGIVSRPNAERLRQRIDDTEPGNIQGWQQLGSAHPDRSRVALAEISAGQPALELVHPEDDRPIKSDPAHHADRLGPQTRDLSLALCRDRPRSRGGSHRPSRIAMRARLE